MKGFMMAWTSGLALSVFFWQAAWLAPLWALETGPDPGQPRRPVRSLQFQEFEDPVEILVPRVPRAAIRGSAASTHWPGLPPAGSASTAETFQGLCPPTRRRSSAIRPQCPCIVC